MDGVGGVGHALQAGCRFRFAHHLIDVMEADVAARPRTRDHGRQRRQVVGILDLEVGGKHAVFPHPCQDVAEPLLGARGRAVGAEIGRPLGHGREQRALGDGQRFGRLAEIAVGGDLDAPCAAAEKDAVEIELEDVILGEGGLEPRRDDHLANLAVVGDVFADQQVLDHLLGDGRTARRPARVRQIADEGANEPVLVDALVLVEALVLGGDEGVAHVLRNLRERDPDTTLVLLEHLGERLVLTVEHDARAGKLVVLELGVVGQVRHRLVVELDHLAEIDGGTSDLLALAKLLVGGEEVVEIDAAQHLRSADRLRIVHRGHDQVVDVDVVDREGLDHVVAAGIEYLRDLLLVTLPVELGLDVVRCCRDLAQSEGGGEDLDEESFHYTLHELGEIPEKT